MHRPIAVFGVWLWAGAAALGGANVAHTDPDFKPVLERISLSPQRVRPGDAIGFTCIFRNRGKRPASKDYRVFVHFEEERNCDVINISGDHWPTVPTTQWTPGDAILDGPHSAAVPIAMADGEYHVHVGVYREEPPYDRLCEVYAPVKLVVDSAAPTGGAVLKPLSADELHRRRVKQAEAVVEPVRLSGRHIELRLSRRTGAFEVLDRATGVVWRSSPWRRAFCEYAVSSSNGASYRIIADRFERVETGRERLRLVHVPIVRGEKLPLTVTFELRLLANGRALELSYATEGGPAWRVTSVKLLDEALWTTNEDDGYVVTPSCIGLLLPASNGRMYSKRLRTFTWGQLHMQMVGVVRRGSAALVSWNDPYAEVEVKSHLGDWPTIPGRQLLTVSLLGRKTVRKCRIDFLGRGGYVEMAKAYRRIAEQAGFVKTWREKLRANPDAAKVFGAPVIKPFVLMGVPPESGRKRIPSFTFDEAAQVAEHLKRDVGVEKALFVLAGWINRGYDDSHPDILPAAPECGGDSALADCSRRVKALGYLFGLHDNYQDMYPPAKSWDERYLMRWKDGKIRKGGVWAGGQCWVINSKMGLELAKRPENLPAVKRLFAPTAYFTDTTFAAPLLEDWSKEHPLTRRDDMRWKRALADYCCELFGFHGSEMGYEWAVPHTHYFEGIMSRSRFSFPPPEGLPIPLFELVYRDCIALYTHQGDRAGPSSAPYILYHLGSGRMPLYRFGNHLYWKTDGPAGKGGAVAEGSVRSMRLAEPGVVEATYQWKALRPMTEKARAFVHFSRRGDDILFQNDHDLPRATDTWRKGGTVVDGPHRFELPKGARGSYQAHIGLFVPGSHRLEILSDNGTGRAFAGTLVVLRDKVILKPPEPQDALPMAAFARVDGGFAATMGATDAFIRNTYEFLSPLNELTAAVPMTDHRFLTPDHRVELTRFGDDVTVVINGSAANHEHDGTTLPPFGFVVTSPTFRAFHATGRDGISYEPSALFAIRSLDGLPLERSGRLRIYHAFGSPRVALRTRRARAVVGGKAVRPDANGRLVIEVPRLEIIELQ